MFNAAERIPAATALGSALQGGRSGPGAAAGYAPSSITITERALAHVYDRHFTGGGSTAGKSIFNDNVVLTRLIADAGDAVSPAPQKNGSLA